MPELPEIETTKRFFEPILCQRQIVKMTAVRPEIFAYPAAEIFGERVQAQQIQSLGRRGKYLLISLADGATLILHLRMTGRLLYCPSATPLMPHTHCIFHLDDGNELRFSDTRRFGRLWLLAANEEDTFSGAQKLGPEPFDAVFTANHLQQKLGQRRATIKSALLDQSNLAGLGNIYADEVLFQTGIHPQCPTGELQEEQWLALATAIQEILSQAIEDNQSRMQDYLAGSSGKYNDNQRLNVYGREKLECKSCGAEIQRIQVAGRSSFFCPACQC